MVVKTSAEASLDLLSVKEKKKKKKERLKQFLKVVIKAENLVWACVILWTFTEGMAEN